MSRGIVKLAEDEYVEWSTVVDAPVTWVMTREEAASRLGEERVDRADKRGTSFLDLDPTTAEEYTAFNRAGENESCLSLEAIRKQYKRESKMIKG